MRRSGRFYRKNEAEVMERLGLRPTPNSGSGWVAKEDGESEHVLAQLKSTDKGSISVKKIDVETLEENAFIEHKLPLFVIQYLSDGSTYLLVKPEDLVEMARFVETGSVSQARVDLAAEPKVPGKAPEKPMVSSGGRLEYLRRQERERERKSTRSARK